MVGGPNQNNTENKWNEATTAGRTKPWTTGQSAYTAAAIAARGQKNEAMRRLLREWLADESGYDEEVWPEVQQLSEDNRFSPRKRFCDETACIRF